MRFFSAPLLVAIAFAAFLATVSACREFSAAKGTADAGEAGKAGDTSPADGGATGGAGSESSSAGSISTAGVAGVFLGSGGAAAGTGGGSAGSSGGAGAGAPASECPCSAPTPTCDAGRCIVRGPTMIKANGYYIDSTEVTAAQYASFAKLKGTDTSGQPVECSWNTSFDPVFEQGAPPMLPSHPVTNVDFCDAKAYCAWADKQLCGRTSGGPLQLPETADPARSQWFAACAGPNSQQYPYGNAHQTDVCNDDSMTMRDVSANSKCQGYYPGLYDMLGNAQEWVDSCDAAKGKTDACERMGGSYATGPDIVCSSSDAAERAAHSDAVGFRCCSIAKPSNIPAN